MSMANRAATVVPSGTMLTRPRQTLALRRLAPNIHSRPSFFALRHSLNLSRTFRSALRASTSCHQPALERNLATAIHGFQPPGVSQIFEIQPFDVSSSLIFGEPATTRSTLRRNVYGLPGQASELVSVFEACIHVGKLDRAALILKRAYRVRVLSAHELIQLHNDYLMAGVARLQAEPGFDKAEELHKWFEVEIRGNEIPHTGQTIAYLLKASLLTSHGPRLKRLVERYTKLLTELPGMESTFLGDTLSAQDLATISEIAPEWEVEKEEGGLDDDTAATEFAQSPVQAGVDFGALSKLSEMPSEATEGHIPGVRETPQKGVGLKTVRQTLSMFHSVPDGYDFTNLSGPERREVQSKLERDSIDAAMARWREEHEKLTGMGITVATGRGSPLSAMMYEWQTGMEAMVQEQIELFEAIEKGAKDPTGGELGTYGPMLLMSTPSRLAAVTLLSVLNQFSSNGIEKPLPVSPTLRNVANVVEEDIRVQLEAKESKKVGRHAREVKVKFRKAIQDDRNPPVKPMTRVDQESSETSLSEQLSRPANKPHMSWTLKQNGWPIAIKNQIAAFLVSCLLKQARILVTKEDPETKQIISQMQPGFSHGLLHKRGRKIGVLRSNAKLAELFTREPKPEALARHLPMIIEPKPWSRFNKGGYLHYTSDLVRIKNGETDQRAYAEAAIDRGDMRQVMKGLDVLGKTAWRINRQVFDVMLEAWNTGEVLANIPPLEYHPKLPTRPSEDEGALAKLIWTRAVKIAMNTKAGYHSQRCFMNLQLEIARTFRDQSFYFPHNMDFRGRAYPVPTYLNHMGADHVRGLLRFSEGRQLGESGLRWLKIHLANVYGYDKASLREREKFATENLANIYDSCENPLKGHRWWLKGEDPWQTLATCFELKAALDSGDPSKFMSQLPVHQDGTCNGLQHYAALGGDSWGAQQVNLEPGDRPADVYTAVAQLVSDMISRDAAGGNALAKAMKGKITRKVVKQTVMTNVYGVTFSGAQKQVRKQLDAYYPNLEEDTGFPSRHYAHYVATNVFKALSTMFSGANEIQAWLGELGGRVCQALSPEQIKRTAEEAKLTPATEGGLTARLRKDREEILKQMRATIVWTTPLRMPVVQPYRKSAQKYIRTCLQDLLLTIPEAADPVHKRKQLQAFPPNFIHSLDASHMLLTALECDAMKLSFAAVHDSFWTHAADVDQMNLAIRNAFIRIHREDVIGRLASEFSVRYRDYLYLARLKESTKAAQAILKWRATAEGEKHKGIKAEMLLEYKRQCLLKSADPKKRVQGEAMLTPARILAAHQQKGTHVSEADDLEETRLGSIPESAAPEEVPELTLESADVELGFSEMEAPEGGKEGAPDVPKHRNSREEKNFFADRIAVTKVQKTAKKDAIIEVWTPLEIPNVPKRGEFDVERLRDSKYFFS